VVISSGPFRRQQAGKGRGVGRRERLEQQPADDRPVEVRPFSARASRAHIGV
jgi:hypothetical protein